MQEVTVNRNDAGQRLDRFLSKRFPAMPKSFVFKAIRNKKIKVNRKRCQAGQKLEEGDTIQLFVKDELLEAPSMTIEPLPSVDVIFENEDLLVVNKPKGLLVQKDVPERKDTLNGRILYYLYSTGQYDPAAENSFRPSAAHRLDRNTSGLVIAAKNAAAARALSEDIREHRIEKAYLALAQGKVSPEKATVYIRKDDLKASVFDHPEEGTNEAVSIIEPLFYNPKSDESLVRVILETGRFHQIRATMAHLGHPLTGDVKYGGKRRSDGYLLQADRIDFSKSPVFCSLGTVSIKHPQTL